MFFAVLNGLCLMEDQDPLVIVRVAIDAGAANIVIGLLRKFGIVKQHAQELGEYAAQSSYPAVLDAISRKSTFPNVGSSSLYEKAAQHQSSGLCLKWVFAYRPKIAISPELLHFLCHNLKSCPEWLEGCDLDDNLHLFVDEFGNLPLHIACRLSRDEWVRFLLQMDTSRVTANQRNCLGQTPLVSVCLSPERSNNFPNWERGGHRRLNIVTALLEENADVTLIDVNRNSPLHHAFATRQHDLIEVLDISKEVHSIRNSLGFFPREVRSVEDLGGTQFPLGH